MTRLLPLLAVLMLLLVACGPERSAPVYLEETVPPCSPLEGVGVDPCEPRAFNGISGGLASESPLMEGDGTAPYTVRWYLGADTAAGVMAAHMVVRATYLPGTVRCTEQDKVRVPTWVGVRDIEMRTVKCYADIRVNEYYLGSGPPMLTVVVMDRFGGSTAMNAERWYARLDGQEEILFLGPGLDYSIEALQAFDTWDVQRDGTTVIAVHPWRDYWLRTTGETHRAALEITLADLATAVTAAQAVRTADYGGRVDAVSTAPMVQTDANKLHDFYVAAGAMDHPDGPPVAPPPSCGLAVPDPTNNGGLLLDCETLLAVKDELRGTGALNWSVDVAIADWDGIRTRDTGRVTDIILVEKGLTGTIPAQLAELTGLKELRLSGNRLTGCVPPSLREVAVNDLDDLGLPECA